MTGPISSRPPLVLITNAEEWSTRALESILGPEGYAVLRAYSGRHALELVRSGRPDLVILSEKLPDIAGLDVCRRIRSEKLVSDSTAILIATPAPTTREQRIDALRAGASECLGLPTDGEELSLRLRAFVRAKLDADLARERGLVDPATGLYNMQGLARKARELGSMAFRNRAAFACVVFCPETDDGKLDPGTDQLMAEMVGKVADTLSRSGRVSDAIGKMGPGEFALLAPETNAEGAELLVQRITRELQKRAADTGEAVPPRMRTGYFAVPDFRDAPVEPFEMLMRAAANLRGSKSNGGSNLAAAVRS